MQSLQYGTCQSTEIDSYQRLSFILIHCTTLAGLMLVPIRIFSGHSPYNELLNERRHREDVVLVGNIRAVHWIFFRGKVFRLKEEKINSERDIWNLLNDFKKVFFFFVKINLPTIPNIKKHFDAGLFDFGGPTKRIAVLAI